MLQSLIPLFALMFNLHYLTGGERYITWSAEEKLTWDDFRGAVDQDTRMQAHTASKLKFSWKCDKGELTYTVHAKFDRTLSWKKELQTDRLLAHEQLHFDITELYARKLKKLLAELKNPCVLPGADVKASAKNLRLEWQTKQDTYDEATNHGQDETAQAEWQQMIADELEMLEAYASDSE